LIPKTDLKTLITNITSWAELESRIADLPSVQQRGEVFEEFCKAFFILDPVFQFKEVYRQHEIPPPILEYLGYPGRKDIGIDGIGVTEEGKVFAYQAKFRSNRENLPTLRELSTFFTLSDHADWRITITNANNLPPAINERARQSRILADRFDMLDTDFFSRLIQYLEENRVVPPVRKAPHRTQQQAIDSALSHYADHSRGQLILPCGAGKTLASLWITEKLGGKFILVMVPSLSLLSQTLWEWAANTSFHPFRYLCVCSDTTVDLGNDAPVEHIYEVPTPVTTEYEAIRQFLAHDNSPTSIVFATYQSSKVLSQAVKDSGVVFDTGIFDEAHRTTGTEVGTWSMALNDANISVKRRIFMTATPRIYAPHITKKAKENDIELCSMDDHETYGKPFCEISFQDAIDRKHITDYKVVVICVTDSEVKAIIEQGGRVIVDAAHEWDARALAKQIALAKGIRAYGLKKIFTFHGRVDSAKAFTNLKTPYGIHNVFSVVLPRELQEKGIGLFHVNGTMSSGQRNSLLREFEKVHIGVMSNARCLTEGVNVPAVDTVAFIDPKKSLIDIVQATGRAMRKAEWKERGYIFLPVLVDENSDPEAIVSCSDFDTVWRVLQAMVDQDQRLRSIVEHMRVMQGKQEEDTQVWKDAMRQCAEKIEFYNLPARIERDRFINKLYTKIIEIIGRSWDFCYGLTLQYKDQYGDPNTPSSYKTPEGYSLGSWQGNQRKNYKENRLSPERVQKLEAVGFTWDILGELFEKGFQETLKYKEKAGDPNTPSRYKTPEGYSLGSWQGNLRTDYRKGELSPERVQRLEALGFNWRISKWLPDRLKWDTWYEMTLHYRDQYGDANLPNKYETAEGYKLGRWQDVQRMNYAKGKLSPERIQRLEAVGFKWLLLDLDEMFEKGIEETQKYGQQTGDPNAPQYYKTPEGYWLGRWQGWQRRYSNKGKLSPEKIQRLEAVGFKWGLLDVMFEKGMEETQKCLQQTGDANAPYEYRTTEGYKLGKWQSRQRDNYRRGKLSTERFERLEKIGFKFVKPR
jgi:superfamily II DNA or RNA helicase